MEKKRIALTEEQAKALMEYVPLESVAEDDLPDDWADAVQRFRAILMKEDEEDDDFEESL